MNTVRVVVLAAGQGTRLKPLTDGCPKCLVRVNGRSILDYQLEVFKKCFIKDVMIVKGFKGELITDNELVHIQNKQFATTNMVHSFFLASNFFDKDIIVSYGDIIYTESVLSSLLKSPYDFTVTIDLDWFNYWKLRMEDPLNDVETLKLDCNDRIIEIGEKPMSIEDIQGQYIGLIYIKQRVLGKILNFYDTLDKGKMYRGKDYYNMFFTTFIQELIDKNVVDVNVNKICGGWMEIDTPTDIELYSIRFL